MKRKEACFEPRHMGTRCVCMCLCVKEVLKQWPYSAQSALNHWSGQFQTSVFYSQPRGLGEKCLCSYSMARYFISDPLADKYCNSAVCLQAIWKENGTSAREDRSVSGSPVNSMQIAIQYTVFGYEKQNKKALLYSVFYRALKL